MPDLSPPRTATGSNRCLLALLAACWSVPVFAHDPVDSDLQVHCQQPNRPAKNVDPAIWNQFLADVDGFRDCTHQAMEQHQAQASAHQDAARLAVDEWNLFVRHSLNAAEDFPHQPQPSRARSNVTVLETNVGLLGVDPQTAPQPQFDAPPPEREAKLTIRRRNKPRG